MVKRLLESSQPYREDIITHPIYSSIISPDELKIFMKFHVFAVWDFMSLLKSLQMNLTCVNIPWVPKGDAETRYLINEIVCGEESDVDSVGNRISHFELYLNAMKECGVSTEEIEEFIKRIPISEPFQQYLERSNLHKSIKEFLDFTFSIIYSNKVHLQAAVFTFGREDLIPGMFISFLKEMKRNFPSELNTFYYYIERHIEIDGGHHSKLAFQMTERLCGNDVEKWKEAEEAIIKALKMRKNLWDAAYLEIQELKKVLN